MILLCFPWTKVWRYSLVKKELATGTISSSLSSPIVHSRAWAPENWSVMKKLWSKNSITVGDSWLIMSSRRPSNWDVTHTSVYSFRRPSIISKAIGLCLSSARWRGVVLLPGFLFRPGSLCKNKSGSIWILASFLLAAKCFCWLMKLLMDSRTLTFVEKVWNTDIPLGNLAIGEILETRPC